VTSSLHLAGASEPLVVIGIFAGAALALGAAMFLGRAFRNAWRATSPEALNIVLDPRDEAELTEPERTSMLLDGLRDGIHYRSLTGAWAREQSPSVTRHE
jgi:hypothetical protein